MSLTEHEQQQLAAIGDALARADPGLDCRLRRLSAYSLEARRMAIAASGTLAFGGGVLLAMGIGMGQRPFVPAGALVAVAAVVTLVGWLIWSRRAERPRPPDPSVPAGGTAHLRRAARRGDPRRRRR